MDEQCHFTCRGPLRREDPFRAIPSAKTFVHNPGFRKGLDVVPTAPAWGRLVKDFEVKDDCVVHQKERIFFKKKKHQTKRVFYEWFNGPLEKAQEVRATCGTRGCVYPPHLKTRNVRSNRENVKEMIRNKARDRSLTQKERAGKYGLSLGIVQKIDQGSAYRDLEKSITMEESASATITSDEESDKVLGFTVVLPPFLQHNGNNRKTVSSLFYILIISSFTTFSPGQCQELTMN